MKMIPVKITALIFMTQIIVFLSPFDAESRIYKRIGKDGTLYYYNKKGQGKFRKREFRGNVYKDLIKDISGANGVDPYLISCIIKVESDFKPDAISAAGAMGLMQLMQETARIYGVKDPLDPEENLKAGIKHMKTLIDYFKNDIPLALAAYHAGIGVVKKRMKLPPIKSTIAYVKKIMKLYRGDYNPDKKVNRLYKRIEKDGTILIYSR
jgi:soluble lytic murein transglycosylase-like protein